MTKTKILFVCLGNICRSPMAETIMKKYVTDEKLENFIEIDSAGLESYHQNEKADSRMRAHASIRGYNITSISRKIKDSDWEYFDMIICMDDQNIRSLNLRAPSEETKTKISRATNFCQEYYLESNIPDPYYGGDQGFQYVIDLLEDACQGILLDIKKRILT